MASITKTYSNQAAPGAASDTLFVRPGDSFTWSSVGTVDALVEVALQIDVGSGAWRDLKRWKGGAGGASVSETGTVLNESAGPQRFRFVADVPTTDPATVLTDYTVSATEAANTLEETRNAAGTTVFKITDSGIEAPVVTATTSVKADTIAERTAAAGVTIDGLLVKDGGMVVSAGSLQFPRGSAATQIIQAFGATSAEGLQMAIVDETVSFVDNTDLFKSLTYLFPAGTQILCAQANIQAALTGGGTTAKLGLGTEADPDLFGKTSALTQNLKITTVPAWSPLSGATYLRLSGCAGDGSAGNTALTVGSVRVRILFIAPVNLADAA